MIDSSLLIKRGLGLSFLVLWLCALQISSATAQSVVPRAELDQQVVLVGEARAVYVLVEFDVQALEQDKQQRPPMNLALVLDRSGSMEAKGKMEYAKQAAGIVVDQLEPSDRLAVIEYDDQISVLWPSAPVEAPAMIKRRIEQLTPRGSTDLTGGMLKGADEVLQYLDQEAVNRVLLLSDGLANHGITEPIQIRQHVRKVRQQGVSISTMGLGLEYNEDLMQAIAENGSGNYYYIENPVQMGRIFQQEMATLFATVAKEVKVEFVASAAVGQVETFGFVAEVADLRTQIAMEDFYSGEKRSLLLRLQIEPEKEGELSLGKLQLAYVDWLSKKPQQLSIELAVRASADSQQVRDSRNENVVVEGALIEADKRHEDYVRLYEQGRKEDAQKQIAQLADEIEGLHAQIADVKLAKKAEALRMEKEEMAAAEEDINARSSYLKKSKQRAYQAKKGKRSLYVLEEGQSGYEVERIQKALKDAGMYQGPIDGKFTAELTEALKEYQRQQQLEPDGVAGPRTLKALQLY